MAADARPEPGEPISPLTPFAHQTWFDDGVYPTDWGFAAEGLTLALLGAALAITLTARLIARLQPGVDVR